MKVLSPELCRTGTAKEIVDLITESSPLSQGAMGMHGQRAMVLITLVVQSLTELRDSEFVQLSSSTIREYLALEKIEDLSRDSRIDNRTRLQLGYFMLTLNHQEEGIDLDETLMRQNFACVKAFLYIPPSFDLAATTAA